MKLTRVFMMALSFFMLALNSAKADITDGKFGINQIFDVQYYWSGSTLNASNFISPYNMNFQHLSGCTASSCSIPAGSYFQFFASTTNPGTYGLALYNADGTVNTVLHNYGNITALGNDAIFYVGSGFFGNVITPSTGYNYGDNAQFTNMDTSVSAADMTGYTWASTTPLSAGQTAGGGGAPTIVSTAPGADIVTTQTTNGTPTTVNSTVYTTAKTDSVLVVTRTTVPVTTTPTTVTTTTTPTTVTTWSDGTTTTANGTPVTTTAAGSNIITNGTPVVDSFSTRIDQYSVLADVNAFANLLSYNNVLNRQSLVDGALRFRGNINPSTSFYTVGERTGEYSINGYTIAATRYGFGLDRAITDNLVVGLHVSRSEHSMSGNNASGGLNKDLFSLHAMYVRKNWIVQNEVGYANNQYSNTHSLPELGLSNSGRRQGNDYWYAARLYAPDLAGLRPFVGGRIERNNIDAGVESGSALTAMSYDAVATNQRVAEYGVRFDRKFQQAVVYAEVAGNSAETMIARLGVGRAITDRVSVMLGATHLRRNDVQSTAGNVVLKIGF